MNVASTFSPRQRYLLAQRLSGVIFCLEQAVLRSENLEGSNICWAAPELIATPADVELD